MDKPVIVLRNVTETEGVEAGTLKLAGIEEENIYNTTVELLTKRRSVCKDVSRWKSLSAMDTQQKELSEAIRYYFGLRKDRPEDY